MRGDLTLLRAQAARTHRSAVKEKLALVQQLGGRIGAMGAEERALRSAREDVGTLLDEVEEGVASGVEVELATAVLRDAALARMTTLGDIEGAYNSLTRALGRYGGDHQTHAVAGMAAQELGRAAEAAEHYRGCLAINDAEARCRSGLRKAEAAGPKGKKRKVGRKKGKQDL